MTTNNQCMKCGSRLIHGHNGETVQQYCADDTCPYSDWPQRVYLSDLHALQTADVERKYGLKKREREAVAPPKVNLCLLAQIRIPVDAPEGWEGMTPEEILDWGNDKLREILPGDDRRREFLSNCLAEDDLNVSMIERHPLSHATCPACGTKNDTDEAGCRECGEGIPGEATDYDVLVTTQEWENFWSDPEACTRIVPLAPPAKGKP